MNKRNLRRKGIARRQPGRAFSSPATTITAIHKAVDDDLPGDFDGPPDRDELLALARRQFPGFYVSASADDMDAMDTLVVLRAALWPILNVPREHVAEVVRRGLELTTNATEQAFAEWRDAVRNSAAFARLSPDEQREIARALFEIRAGPDE